jgi:hypothetical protein
MCNSTNLFVPSIISQSFPIQIPPFLSLNSRDSTRIQRMRHEHLMSAFSCPSILQRNSKPLHWLSKTKSPYHSDSDWNSDPNGRKSYTGYVFLINGGAVSCTSHTQTTVALSMIEAEYMTLSDASRAAIERLQFFQESYHSCLYNSYTFRQRNHNQSHSRKRYQLPVTEKLNTLIYITMRFATTFRKTKFQ